MKNRIKKVLVTFVVVFLISTLASVCYADSTFDMSVNGDSVETLDVILMLTFISLVPSLLYMTTCFTRIVIVLSFLRNAMGLQQTPPNQVLVGIAVFLTLFVMSPVLTTIDETALQPYLNEEITQQEFYEQAQLPLKEFMIMQIRSEDLNTFLTLSRTELDNSTVMTNQEMVEQLPMTVIIPSFITSELRRAFIMGFLIYIPFLVIDMVVSSALMSMGMMMLPPVMISMPFKILIFVLVDGWSLLIKTLAMSFNV